MNLYDVDQMDGRDGNNWNNQNWLRFLGEKTDSSVARLETTVNPDRIDASHRCRKVSNISYSLSNSTIVALARSTINTHVATGRTAESHRDAVRDDAVVTVEGNLVTTAPAACHFVSTSPCSEATHRCQLPAKTTVERGTICIVMAWKNPQKQKRKTRRRG